MPAPLILASASPSRRQLLASAGLSFAIEPSGVDEDEVKHSLIGEQASPQDIATTLAEMKAVRVSQRHGAAMVIGADSTLACNGRLFDKPATLAAARRQLSALGGRVHELCSSVVVARDGVRLWHWSERAHLTMRPFTESFLDAYLARAGRPWSARSVPISSRGWAHISSARSRATTSPSSACRCCRCSRSWRSTAS